MILHPLHDFIAFMNETYVLVVIGLAIIYASLIMHINSESEVSNPLSFLTLTVISAVLFCVFAFFMFFVIRHVFGQGYEYLQLSASFCLVYLSLFGCWLINAVIFERESLHIVLLPIAGDPAPIFWGALSRTTNFSEIRMDRDIVKGGN